MKDDGQGSFPGRVLWCVYTDFDLHAISHGDIEGRLSQLGGSTWWTEFRGSSSFGLGKPGAERRYVWEFTDVWGFSSWEGLNSLYEKENISLGEELRGALGIVEGELEIRMTSEHEEEQGKGMDEGQLTSTHSGWGADKDFQSFKSAMAVVFVLLSVPLMVLLDVVRFATEIESASSGELSGSVINSTEAHYAAQRGTGQL